MALYRFPVYSMPYGDMLYTCLRCKCHRYGKPACTGLSQSCAAKQVEEQKRAREAQQWEGSEREAFEQKVAAR